jgi:DNA mismatch repair protein MutS
VFDQYRSVADIFNSLGINDMTLVRKSLVAMLSFISNYYGKTISGTKPPTQYIGSTYLQLGNDAINQLNVIAPENKKGLIDYLNVAQTPMGKRFVRLRLISPLASGSATINGVPVGIDELNKTYKIVERIRNKSLHMPLEKSLKRISDIDKLKHRMVMSRFTPRDICAYLSSYDAILDTFRITKNLTGSIQTNELRSKIKNLIKSINKTFNLDICNKHGVLTDIDQNIFNRGVHKDIDVIEDRIGKGEEFLEKLIVQMEKLMVDRGKTYNQRKIPYIQLKHDKSKGHYLNITKKRYTNLLKDKLFTSDIVVDGTKINVTEFEIDEKTKTNVKIFAPFMKANTDNIESETNEMKLLNKAHFQDYVQRIYKKYEDMFDEVSRLISRIDYYYCIARVSKEYGYCKPIIDHEAERSYISTKSLRHPIVERIIMHEYIPHDIEIGKDMKGMMLYGLNSAGKSVLMKAIGLSLIMAQAGFYVPAESFVYKPYNACYTRITGTDDIYRGLSSYSLEMVELNASLKRADENTLIIGDEVCRGTESISGSAIVAATLLRLNKLNSSFVFATHLHDIMNLEDIKNCDTIKAYHLSVEHDAEMDCLVYDRLLKPGPGERIYGITVAKSIINDMDFINDALRFKNIIMDIDGSSPIVAKKKSRYNSKIYVDKCGVCNMTNSHMHPTPLEVHHINYQKDCKDGFAKNKSHIKKNSAPNLVPICQKCHDAEHAGEIRIQGYRITSKGRKVIVKKQ